MLLVGEAGRCQLVDNRAEELCADREIKKAIFTAFVLCRRGFQAPAELLIGESVRQIRAEILDSLPESAPCDFVEFGASGFPTTGAGKIAHGLGEILPEVFG